MKKNIIIPKEVNDAVDIYLENNEVKNMADIEKMMSSFFGPAIQKILEAEMDVKLKYDNKDVKPEERNYRNGYQKERKVNSSYGEIPVSVPDVNVNIKMYKNGNIVMYKKGNNKCTKRGMTACTQTTIELTNRYRWRLLQN